MDLQRCPRKCVLAANFILTLKIFGFGRVVVDYWVPSRPVHTSRSEPLQTIERLSLRNVVPLVVCPERRYRGAKWIRPPAEKHGLESQQVGSKNVGQQLRMANGPQT